ncbi:uncharacterized protein PGRI_055150 [Penicillium griseofulvum]|uniref:Apple domain-containing protein n=1 Tax=Penicillium patulum TaxID=5078 RepID=A0A135LCH0_PENPA|nr:uncharacterized protein PGRI_055150 [Penicillium griseofulvum]KXG46659.1 hypothetical protein PGRI_055150 [Penicillium griseofulvum]
MVKLLNLLFLCGAQLLAEIPSTHAQGLVGQGSGVAGARFGQGSGSRSGLGRGCCCFEEPEPEPEDPVECNPQCPSAHAKIFQCNGRKYKQFCGIHVATPTLREFDVPSYQACFDSCVQEPLCHALDFMNNHCWLKTEGVDPPPKPMPSDQDISIIFL